MSEEKRAQRVSVHVNTFEMNRIGPRADAVQHTTNQQKRAPESLNTPRTYVSI